MSTKQKAYTPAWIDKDGNRMIFGGEDNLHFHNGECHGYQYSVFAFYAEMGLKMDGVASLEPNDRGTWDLQHCKVKYGPYDAKCIAGPIFEQAKAEFEAQS